jgi:hypothetical protein
VFFQQRPIAVQRIADAGLLAEKLFETTWCSCDAFDFGGIVFVNDSTCPDGAQEFAVIVTNHPGSRDGRQTDSITFGWMKTVDEVFAAIVRAVSDDNHNVATKGGVLANGAPATIVLGARTALHKAPTVRLNAHPNGYCSFCR